MRNDASHWEECSICYEVRNAANHIATFLYRACGGTGSGWYEVARDWAVDAFLLDDTGMTVSPDEPCPRAAVVTFLYRIYN